jgi:heat shock protein HslJ
MSPAQTIIDIEWQLLAINGAVTESGTTLRIGADGMLVGAGPCNSWSSTNVATLPALELRGIRATRRACDKLAEERVFFDTLSAMTTMALDGDRSLVLTGPDGRSMEFVIERTVCKTCRTGG